MVLVVGPSIFATAVGRSFASCCINDDCYSYWQKQREKDADHQREKEEMMGEMKKMRDAIATLTKQQESKQESNMDADDAGKENYEPADVNGAEKENCDPADVKPSGEEHGEKKKPKGSTHR